MTTTLTASDVYGPSDLDIANAAVMARDEMRARNDDTPEPMSRICPQHIFALLDDGMGNLVFQNADAWAAAHYHAHHP